MSDDVQAITAALAAPFDPREVKWKPSMVKNNRALAMAYVSARTVMDRLDEVLGPAGWQDEYTPLPDGSMMCRLQLRLGGAWVAKTDVGSPSEQPDEGDRVKASVSDALKRAAVKFGVGRYLYRLPSQWVDYDAAKKQITAPPQLPPWALPGGKPAPARPAPAAAAGDQEGEQSADPAQSVAAFLGLLRSKGKQYAAAVGWLNTQVNARYGAEPAGWLTIPLAHRQLLVDATSQPAGRKEAS